MCFFHFSSVKMNILVNMCPFDNLEMDKKIFVVLSFGDGLYFPLLSFQFLFWSNFKESLH